jgi:RNA polymerase sigma-70 factor (ECF subfamily)
VRSSAEATRAAFAKLFRDTRADLLAYILRRSPNAEEAADVLAETYYVAWRKLDRIPNDDRARLWLFGVARNLLRKGVRRRHYADKLVERLAAELRTAPPAQRRDDPRLADIRRALARLSAPDREILTLTAWEGLTPSQISIVMGISANVVRVRLHRARTRLKRELEIPTSASLPAEQLALGPDG